MRSIFLVTLILVLNIPNNLFSQRGDRQRGNRGDGNSDADMGVCSISGSINDQATNLPIEYVSVSIYSEDDSKLITGVITKPDGSFSISKIPYGSYYIEASFVGYKPTRVKNVVFTPIKCIIATGPINLSESITTINEVQIIGERKLMEYKIDKKVINVSQDVLATGGTAANVLESSPAVQTDEEGNITLRGSSNFKVLIDGKPSIIQGSDALQQIPATLIQQIEIITNPSAKYEADATAGIVNIITKRQKLEGVSGLFNGTVGYKNKYNGDALISIKTGKVNFFTGIEYMNGNNYFKYDRFERYVYKDSTFENIINADGSGVFGNKTFKIGADYTINNKNTISFKTNIGQRTRNRDFIRHEFGEYRDNITKVLDSSFYVRRNDFADRSNKVYRGSVDYTKLFDSPQHKLELSLDIDYSPEESSSNNNAFRTSSTYEPPFDTVSYQQGTSSGKETETRFKLDYTRPFTEKSKLETGFQIDLNSNTSYNKDSTSLWNKKELLINDYDFINNIYAGYVVYSNTFAPIELGYQLGLRTEVIERNLKSDSIDMKLDPKLDWFPSVHLSKQLPFEQQIMLSYTRKIERPDERALDPQKRYSEPTKFRTGNPALLAEYTHSISLGYQKTIMKSGSISIESFVKQTNNNIENLDTTEIIKGIIYEVNKPFNVNKIQSGGIEFSSLIPIVKWWNVNITGQISMNQLDNNGVIKNYNNWSCRFSNTFKVLPTTRIQLSGNYRGDRITTQGKQFGNFIASLGVRHEFNKKASLNIQVQNVLNTAKYRTYTYVPNYKEMTFYREWPVITATFSYKFNNFKQQQTQGGGDYNEVDLNGYGGF